jgi:hypothetical protein
MLDSQLEVVQQAKQFLSGLHIEEYTTTVKPHFSASAAVHMRHVLDHYFALMAGLDEGVVNYNIRNRFSDTENCPKLALDAWVKVEQGLLTICKRPLDLKLHVISETSVSRTHIAKVSSTLARELVFVSSHAIHHFSLIAVMRSLQGKSTADQFGIAPATATFIQKRA